MKYMPFLLVVINLAAAVVYGLNHDLRRSLYYSLSAGLIASVSL